MSAKGLKKRAAALEKEEKHRIAGIHNKCRKIISKLSPTMKTLRNIDKDVRFENVPASIAKKLKGAKQVPNGDAQSYIC